MSRTEAPAPPKLARELGLIDATAIVVGSMIGSGIFITSAESARILPAPGWLLVAWAVAGLLTITGALCCSELSAMLPKAGGQYVFLREAYGPAIGFAFGWANFLVVGTGTIAAVAVAFSRFLGVFTKRVSESAYIVSPIRVGGYAFGLSTQQLVAILLIAGLTVLNMRGLQLGKLVQNVFTSTKTLALFGLIVVGLTLGFSKDAAAFTSSWWNPAANGWRNPAVFEGPAAEFDPITMLQSAGVIGMFVLLGRAMVGPLFSQTAWNSVTFTGGEIRDPGRTLPRALVLGCGLVVVLYLLANVAYIVALPLDMIREAPEDRVATVLMQRAIGPIGVRVMAAFILISTFGCVNGLVLSGARVYYAMARDGLFFKAAGATNARQVPAFALVAQGIWAALLTLPRTVTDDPTAVGGVEYGNLYSDLLGFVVSADLMFYALMVFAVVALRRRAPGLDRPFRVPLYPLPVIVYVAISVFLLLVLVGLTPKTSGIGFLIALSGLPVYLLWRRGSPAPAAAD